MVMNNHNPNPNLNPNPNPKTHSHKNTHSQIKTDKQPEDMWTDLCHAGLAQFHVDHAAVCGLMVGGRKDEGQEKGKTRKEQERMKGRESGLLGQNGWTTQEKNY